MARISSIHALQRVPRADRPRDESQMKEVIKAYDGDISCLDEQIGTS